MPKKRLISQEESKLFIESMKSVRPLKHDKVLTPKPSLSAKKIIKQPPPLFEEWDDVIEQPIASPNDKLLYRKPGLQDQVLRKLKRGQFPIEGKLDLHGLTTAKAKSTLYHFIQQAYDHHLRCVLVVHGKGYSSQNGHPVLKNSVNHWLRQSPYVVGFCTAQDKDGSTGALYVLIKVNAGQSK